jgi:uncharacterized membrane protein YidH (DUF202 family)
MNKSVIKNNITSFSILLFVVFFAIVQIMAPAFLYNEDGSLREFGLGTKKRTVLPIWLFAIIIAILAYLCVLYYCNSHFVF